MFGGLFAMIAVSYLVYRRAQESGRSGLLWGLLLWPIAFGGGILTGMARSIMLMSSNREFHSDQDLQSELIVPVAMGILGDAIFCVWIVGRKRRQEEGVNSSP